MNGNERCVLVVEDDDVVRGVVTVLLEDEGYRVVSAPHGAAALQLLTDPAASALSAPSSPVLPPRPVTTQAGRSAPPPGPLRPDVILLDLWMPVMDGHAFIAAYRRLPAPHAPIIAMTGAFFADTARPAPQADALLAKPFDLDDLLALVREHATRKGTISGAERILVSA